MKSRTLLSSKRCSRCMVAAVVLSSTLLTGCLGVFVAGAAAGGAIIYDRRTAEVQMEDKSIVFKIHREVQQQSIMDARSHIEITSFNRIVLVTGEVPDAATKERVLNKVKAVPRIRRVYDQIFIGPSPDLTERSRDTWITAKVKSLMVATEGLHSSQIKVVTEGGAVYLLGLVTPNQAELAVRVAREVNGVKRVVKLFEYER
jgi:osmotically-inducible protein OsmY